MLNIALLLIDVISLIWPLKVIGAGVGQMERNSQIPLSWRNISLIVVSLGSLIALDRYWSSVKGEIATWHLIPVFFSGLTLVTVSILGSQKTSR
jgi:hypothetical protein